RRKIQEAIAEGFKPEQIVVVTGAFHATALGPELPPMTDEEFAKLRKRESKMTLMPYSFFKLSSQSGYGAGNHAPAYFEMVWSGFNETSVPRSSRRKAALAVESKHGSENDQSFLESAATNPQPASLPTLFLTRVARELRAAGTFRSTAEVIEAVRLAEAMADMKNSSPTLRELQDAAVTLLGQGDPALVRESLLRVEVGTAIGALAKGVSQTSIQDDFYRELTRLKLDPFKAAASMPGDKRRETSRASSAEVFRDAAFFRGSEVAEGAPELERRWCYSTVKTSTTKPDRSKDNSPPFQRWVPNANTSKPRKGERAVAK